MIPSDDLEDRRPESQTLSPGPEPNAITPYQSYPNAGNIMPSRTPADEGAVRPVAVRIALLGAAIISGISLFEQVPVLGWLGGFIEVALWFGLAYWFVALAKDRMQNLSSPGVASLGIGAAIGAFTGLIAVIASLALTILKGILFAGLAGGGDNGVAARASGVGFDLVGTTLSLFYWPLVGAFWCGVAGIFFAAIMVKRGVVPAAAGYQQPYAQYPPGPSALVPGTRSPDGNYIWDGSQWVPVRNAHQR
jgi:hypothetical protein